MKNKRTHSVFSILFAVIFLFPMLRIHVHSIYEHEEHLSCELHDEETHLHQWTDNSCNVLHKFQTNSLFLAEIYHSLFTCYDDSDLSFSITEHFQQTLTFFRLRAPPYLEVI